MKLYVELELSPRPEMTHPLYLEAVQRAASELRAAEPWLLVSCGWEPRLVARRRSLLMALVTWCVNWYRRPRRWYLGRLRLARERRYGTRGDRNG